MLRLAVFLAAAAIVPAFAAPAPTNPTGHPLLPLLDAAGIERACNDAIAQARNAITAMGARRGAGAIFDEWNRLSIQMEDTLNPIYLMANVSPDKAVRDAAEPCLQKFTALGTDLFQDEKLFARVSAAKPANPHQAKLKRDLMDGFEDSGVALPPEKRARAKAIFDELEELRQAFDRSIREDPARVKFTPEEMEGLPESYLR